jgi:DNA-binding NtrC family response regulator
MAALLIVDDDEAIRDTLYDLFSDSHLCHVADTADRAIGWLDQESYDVVLTDISMPGVSGVELLGHVRQRQPDTPVIVISGITDRHHAEGLLRLGAFAYLLKPFRLEEVEQCVESAIERHTQLVEGRG